MSQTTKVTVEDLLRMQLLQRDEHHVVEAFFDQMPISSSSAKDASTVLARLKADVMTAETFGELLHGILTETNESLVKLAGTTATPEPTLRSLLSDAVFPFAVPVMYLKRLIMRLNIDSTRALGAIQRTGDMLADILDESNIVTKFGLATGRKAQMESEFQRTVPFGMNSETARASNAVYLERLRETLLERG